MHGPGGIGKTTLLLEYRARRADEVFARPGMAERVMRLGAHAPRYRCPGRAGRQLLAAISG